MASLQLPNNVRIYFSDVHVCVCVCTHVCVYAYTESAQPTSSDARGDVKDSISQGISHAHTGGVGHGAPGTGTPLPPASLSGSWEHLSGSWEDLCSGDPAGDTRVPPPPVCAWEIPCEIPSLTSPRASEDVGCAESVYAYTHTCVHTYTHTCTSEKYIRSLFGSCKLAIDYAECVYTYIHTYIQTYTDTYIHAYIHVYIHALMNHIHVHIHCCTVAN